MSNIYLISSEARQKDHYCIDAPFKGLRSERLKFSQHHN